MWLRARPSREARYPFGHNSALWKPGPGRATAHGNGEANCFRLRIVFGEVVAVVMVGGHSLPALEGRVYCLESLMLWEAIFSACYQGRVPGTLIS